MNVKVYSTSWCPYCHAEMDWLDELGVKYEEVDAEDMELSSIPVTEIGDEKIVGFDRPAILAALEKAGIYKK
ncbi:glutaredoxin family protein [Candidatus Saccharibacteria bacterium]|nr:glutaredoxin family protein [Candidatus Saccharibacteria bacterium]